jgi:endoribonuclease Dicer
MVDSHWTKGFWVEELDKNMVIVCTAAILQKMLAHSFVKISQISLLIFDECHHAKKNHPYARIIKDFYVDELDETKRPRIFGMTASPVDARCNVEYAAQELEMLLCSEIATVPETLIDSGEINQDRHTEIHETYKKLLEPYKTPLCEKISFETAGNKRLSRLVTLAMKTASELGPWCADEIWKFHITELEVPKIVAQISKDAQNSKKSSCHEQTSGRDPAEVVKHVWEIVKRHKFGTPMPIDSDISEKVRRLRQLLFAFFSQPTQDRCIIFVEQRLTARLLAALFEFEEVRPAYLKMATIVS